MPASTLELDVLVKGAGPAGLTCALRLQQLGYRVGVVDRMTLPRAQIGEALTPGVANILDLLGAHHILDAVPCQPAAPALIAWNSREPELLHGEGAGALLVDRGAFDSAMLSLFSDRGGFALAPSRLRSVEGEAGAWRVTMTVGGEIIVATARVLIDASGRAATQETRRFATAPPLLATWVDLHSIGVQEHTLVEALTEGWLWGAALPGGRFRVMLLDDPRATRRSCIGTPTRRLQEAVDGSQLFASNLPAIQSARVQACAATSYIDERAWSATWIKTGDAAFAVDPLSSSGVEKAMRFSLQTAVAVHTLIADSAAADLASRFHFDRLIEGAERHAAWSQRHYREGWPGSQHQFWATRGADVDFGGSAIGSALRNVRREREVSRPPTRGLASSYRNENLRVSHELGFADELCVVNDIVQLCPAVTHPGLERPTAFVQGQGIVPLLQIARSASRLDTIVGLWSYTMPAEAARHIALWMLEKGLLTAS